ncbi:hypothetical protein [Paraburkholderia bannensis]|uniref:hypothetical protein n=1 Tax=Paraburkholderia bannensis TaxID=765414 RepID=UPI001FE046A4|nr:hypothetical protein [Paraburkholderia bannensis]
MTHQRVGARSNAHAGRDFEVMARHFFAGQGVALPGSLKVMLGIGMTKKDHAFDLGCEEQKILVECKSHRWTRGARIPVAKLTVWNEAMYYFSLAPGEYRKVMFVLRDECRKRGLTLADYYLRTYAHLVPPDVEFWECDDTNGTAVCIRAALTS